MTTFHRQLPSDAAKARRALYAGEFYLLPARSASTELVNEVLALLIAELGEPAREAQFRLSGPQFFAAIGRLRKTLFHEPRIVMRARQLMNEVGFEPSEFAFDPPRLRVICYNGHQNSDAASIYYCHRDTWYSHPQALLNWWVPLHDLTEEETFVFYPECFAKPVANDSHLFDYDAWVRDRRDLRIGWQSADAGRSALYPAAREHADFGRPLPFACRAGEILLFSGAQLHQTRPITTGQTRFSIDFRTVHLGDHALGLGAPNVDSRSRGSALADYIRSGEVSSP